MAKRGLSGIREAAAEIAARRESMGPWINWLKIPNGQSVRVRFLEQGDDVEWCWVHQTPAKAGQKYGDNEVCLNQDDDGTPCPGCERMDGTNYRRIINGFINVIYRNAPVWEVNENGRMPRGPDNKVIYNKVAEKDQIFVWKGGKVVFEELDGKDATYRGLMSRDFVITRRGEALDTKYTIEPADPDAGPQPMSDADKKLVEEKYDLKQFTTPPPYDEWGQARTSQPEGERGDADGSAINPFLARRSE